MSTTDTFTDAQGRRHIAGHEVPEAVWARHEVAAINLDRIRAGVAATRVWVHFNQQRQALEELSELVELLAINVELDLPIGLTAVRDFLTGPATPHVMYGDLEVVGVGDAIPAESPTPPQPKKQKRQERPVTADIDVPVRRKPRPAKKTTAKPVGERAGKRTRRVWTDSDKRDGAALGHQIGAEKAAQQVGIVSSLMRQWMRRYPADQAPSKVAFADRDDTRPYDLTPDQLAERRRAAAVESAGLGA